MIIFYDSLVWQNFSSSWVKMQSMTPSQTLCNSKHWFPHWKQLFLLCNEIILWSLDWYKDFFTRFNESSHLKIRNIRIGLEFNKRKKSSYLKASLSIRRQSSFNKQRPPQPVGSEWSLIFWQIGESSVTAIQTSLFWLQSSQYLTSIKYKILWKVLKEN